MRTRFTCAMLAALHAASLLGQEMTLRQAVERAIARYPSVRVSAAQLAAATAGIALARTSYLPRTDLLAQVNRATRNNVFGMLMPQPVLPSISGPPNPVNSMTSVWGSASGMLVSWEPFDLGLRRAQVTAAEAARGKAEAALERTRFEVSVLASDAYLTAVAAEQTLRAAQAQLERATTVEKIVDALVRAELRAGADLSRIRAEVAAAEAQVVRAEAAVQTARATLRQLTGDEVRPVSSGLLTVPDRDPEPEEPRGSPYAREQEAAVAEAESQRRILERSYFPRFHVQGATYARGTGANPDGSTLGGGSGLGPNIVNWGLGVTVTFPVLDFAALRVRKKIAEQRRLAELARYDQVVTDLDARLRTAREQLAASRRIAQLAPRQVEAAQAAEQQSVARYSAGLGTLVEVADSQRLLTQAQMDDALARLGVWRAMLAAAAAAGDLTPFLEQVK